MSYRNDHDAALLRVDALEQEVARLKQGAPAAKPATKPKGHASLFRIVLATVLVSAGVAAVIGRDRPTVAAAPAPVAVERETPSRLDDLRECVAAIAPVDGLDEITTDPHGAANSTAVVARSGARCRSEITSFAAGLNDVTQLQLRRWADAEDQLAGPISMIGVYYGNDPYRLDNYGTAAQLWREFHRARATRDAALADVKRTLSW